MREPFICRRCGAPEHLGERCALTPPAPPKQEATKEKHDYFKKFRLYDPPPQPASEQEAAKDVPEGLPEKWHKHWHPNDTSWGGIRATRLQDALSDLAASQRRVRELESLYSASEAGWQHHYERAIKAESERDAALTDLTDFRMVMDHCSRIYMWASGGRISKPNTLPEEVMCVAEEIRADEDAEELAELTAERDAAIARAEAAEAEHERLCEDIDEHLPQWALSDDDSDTANERERVEYAGKELAELRARAEKAEAELRRLKATCPYCGGRTDVGTGLCESGEECPAERLERADEYRRARDEAIRERDEINDMYDQRIKYSMGQAEENDSLRAECARLREALVRIRCEDRAGQMHAIARAALAAGEGEKSK
jgi:hypothetical protein